MNSFDVIVIGVGGWGSAALYHLARRGLKVCGVEQFAVGHDRGSSHGDSRAIRMAYFLHPDYVPVLRRAYELWRELEAESGGQLMTMNGLLCIGEPDGAFIRGLERCYTTHEIDHERLTPAEAMRRFPQFALPDNAACYWDPFGGFLRPEACVRAHVQGALRAGATLVEDAAVIAIEHEIGGVIVRTPQRTLRAAKVVLSGGAFTNRLLRAAGSNPVQPLRKVFFWYGLTEPPMFEPERFPVWIAKLAGLDCYGFPTLDGATVKAAEDSGGQVLDDAEQATRELLPGDEAGLRGFVDRLFPSGLGERARHKTCLYENSADHHFIVDVHPRWPNVVVAAGGSGHGFKFCSMIGEMVANLIERGAARSRPEIFAGAGRL